MLEFKLIYGSDGYNAAKKIRETVFMEEQGFSYDKDEHDCEAWHIVGYEKGRKAPLLSIAIYLIINILGAVILGV